MRLPSVPTLPMSEHLNTSYFHRLWNAPGEMGRANFELRKAAKSVQIGAVPVNQSVVGLPTTDKVYAVYRVPPHVFGRFVNFKPDTWVTDLGIVTSDFISIITYDKTGRRIPTGHIHLYYDPMRATVIVAIERGYTIACTGKSYPELYMTLVRDINRTTRILSQTYKVSGNVQIGTTPQTVNQAIVGAKTQYPLGTMVFINGWLYDPSVTPALVTGDVVEVTSDPDIVAYCDINIDDNHSGYYSDKFGEYREMLHIPKAINPNNYIITHETLAIGIFDSNTGRGVYGHRLNEDAIESITHNDFSMSRAVLDAFELGLESKSAKVRLYIRLANDHQILSNDINRIEDLYTLDDDEICKQLVGLSAHQVAEWKARHLEQSMFLELLYKFDGFSYDTVITKFVEAMGYYDVAAALGQTMHYYTYKGGEVTITKPIRLRGYPCRVLAYANGRKVPEHALRVTDAGRDYFSIGFAAGGYVAPGTKIAVYVAEGGVRTIQPFNPTLEAPSIIVDSDDYSLVKIVSYDTPQPVWNGSVTKGYHTYPISPADYITTINANNTVTYTVRSGHHGEHFYLVPNCGLDTITYSLDDLLAAKQALVFPLETTDQNGNALPQIGQKTIEIYINGYRLIEGVDYTCNPIMGHHGDVLQMVLAVSNIDYANLQALGNTMEVILHGDSVVSVDKGYVISNLMKRTMPPMVWDATCGRAFAQGKLVTAIHEEGAIMVADTPIANGAPYLLEWTIPYGVAKLMASVAPTSDIDLRTRILRVLKLHPPSLPDTVIVTHLYALYSPYLAKIITDVASGDLVLINEPSDDLFLKQLDRYDLLLERDPVLGTANALIDRRFVTIAAHYANFAVQDYDQMFMVQRLIHLLLTPSELAINEVLV
jgi:hypothetical protein